MNPVVFLDIDGVVVTKRSLLDGPKTADPSCVARLNSLISETNADVVVSSSWRMAHTIEFIRETLCAAGFSFPERIIDRTEHLTYRVENGTVTARAERHDEIRAWLSVNPRDSFVILDDDWDAEITGHFVRTCSEQGLEELHLNHARRILSRGFTPEMCAIG